MRPEYEIVFYDVVTRDYSSKLNGNRVFRNVKKYTRNGSIIVFHDSLRSVTRLKFALPKSIEWLTEQGYSFKTL
jgi:peptidoglycan/xylan/chitin deacetylase (PgdA/CDA1 family)